MRSSKSYYGVLILMFAVFLYYRHHAKMQNVSHIKDALTESPIQKTEATESQPEKTKLAPTPLEPKPAMRPQMQEQQIKAQELQMPISKSVNLQSQVKKNHLVFERKMNDWAVAFGDVLLGKITTDFAGQFAQIEASSIKLWKNGTIPYAIDATLPNPQRILDVIQYFNENTPVKFVPAQQQKDGLYFTTGEENCYSYVGRVGGFQPIFLSDNCNFSEITHELMHALGFVHEHSRTDRDKYVDIDWSNVAIENQIQFLEVPSMYMLASQTGPFDYGSIMIYSPEDFALDNSRPVIKSKTEKEIKPAETALSDGDLSRLYSVYGK